MDKEKPYTFVVSYNKSIFFYTFCWVKYAASWYPTNSTSLTLAIVTQGTRLAKVVSASNNKDSTWMHALSNKLLGHYRRFEKLTTQVASKW